MKDKLYKVYFTDGNESIVYANSPVSAAIQASSDRLRSNKDWHITGVEDQNGRFALGSLQFVPLER